TPVDRCHVRGQDHRVRVVVLGERIGVTRSGQSGPARVGGVDRLFGFGGGVGWRCGLAAEGGGEENEQGLGWAHGASPLGEGEGDDDTGLAAASQAALILLMVYSGCSSGRCFYHGL